MKYLLSVVLLLVLPMTAFAQTNYDSQEYVVYVDPLPEWADYAANVMYESTTAWTNANPNIKFYQADDPRDADFRVQWVKEFGVEHVGYAYGNQFIEVGLGDSYCYGTWSPFSSDHVADIMKHEIGHILGLDHSDDVDSIMYPIALNKEYGIVEFEKTLTNGYGYFTPLCTVKDVTTYSYNVSTDDPTYGFDVYFVPSIQSFHDWSNGDSFDYYINEGCHGENYLSYGGTCEGISKNAGLLILMNDYLTDPLTTITVKMQETLQNQISTEIPAQNEYLPTSPMSFSTYIVANHFSIEYPESWIIDTTGSLNELVSFFDQEDASYMSIGDIGPNPSKDILSFLKQEELDICNDYTYETDGFICKNFTITDENLFDDSASGYVATLSYTISRQYQDLVQDDYTIILYEISDGSSTYQIYSDIYDYYVDEHYPLLVTSMQSFEILGENGKVPESTPKPTPMPVPHDVDVDPEERIIDIFLDDDTIYLNEKDDTIRIYGNIDDPRENDNVAIVLTSPNVTSDGFLILPDKNGYFERHLSVDSFAQLGTYELLATVGSDILDKFYITAINDDTIQIITDSTNVYKSDDNTLPYRNTHVKDFPSMDNSPSYYIQRYNVEPAFQKWYDEQFPHIVITDIVSYKQTHIPNFPEDDKSPKYYIDRYNNESAYKEWFDSHFSDSTIYDILGMSPLLMPGWTTSMVDWWHDGRIMDVDFIKSLLFLINNDIIQLKIENSLTHNDIIVTEQTKQNTKLWLDGSITDEQFLNSIFDTNIIQNDTSNTT